MTFSAENQPTNRKSGPNIKAKIIAALGRREMTEEQFIDKWIELAIGDGKEIPGGGVFMSELLKRYSPIPKQSHETIVIENWPKNGTPAEKASAVLECMSEGIIPPDLGALFIESISKSLGIEEVTDLAERMIALEKLMESHGLKNG